MKLANIKTSSDFIREIEKMVRDKNVGYFDAVLLYCERNNIELETAASLVKGSSVLKARIQVEAEGLNMVKKQGAKLPI